MKSKLLLCLALVLSGGLATFSTSAADTGSLRVVIIPSKTEVRIGEPFNVELRVENPTQTNQTVRVWSCSWDEEWQSSNTNISWMPWVCTRNFPVNVVIPPGGAYTNEAPMCIYNLIPDKELSFHMGFTPIGSKESYWSNEVKLHILPPDITNVKLKIVSVDSEETNGEDGYAANAVDGNPNTYWHTQWRDNSPGLPHEIVIELVPPCIIKGFTYLPRQDESDHGTIKDYEFYVSDDGTNFGQPVKKGTFESGKDEKFETFDPIKCRYIKLKALSEINGLPWTSAAEIGVIQNDENVSVMTNPVAQAENLLVEFEMTKSIDKLEETYVAVGNIPEPGVDKAVPKAIARREKTLMLFKLLAVIDRNIDTNFYRPNNTNYIVVVNMYYPGVDLKMEKDPAYRLKFETAVKQNNERILQGAFQTRLHNIDQSANIFVERFLRYNYTTSEEDQSELDDLMRQAQLSPDRVQRIMALFEPASHAVTPEGGENAVHNNSLEELMSIRVTAEEMTNSDAKQYFKDYLAKCDTNEIRCVWFLRNDPQIGMVMMFHLDQETVFTVRDVFCWAFQDGDDDRRLTYSQWLNLKQIISDMPQSDKNVDFNKSVFISVRNGQNVEVFQYDRHHPPAIIERIYDIGGGYFETNTTTP